MFPFLILSLSLLSPQVQVSGQVTISGQVAMTNAQGVAAAVTVSPSGLSFGTETVGLTTASQPVTLANIGGSDLSISSIALTGTAAGDFGMSSTCGSTLISGATCTASVTFSPSTSGTRSANLVFTDSASSSPQTVTLSGVGQYGPAVSLTPTSISFGSQAVGTTSAARPVTLTNSGGSAVTLTSVSISGANAANFAISANTCGSSVAAGASCAASITFTPSATGTRTATLSFTDNAPGSPQSVALSGTGVTAGGLTINPGDDIQTKINANATGTTFHISAGTYRITTALAPKTGDSFIGSASCNPIASPGSCTAIISGSVSIGGLATFDGTNYKVTGQAQHGSTVSTADCISGHTGCIYPEDLFFDGVPLQHLNSATKPTIPTGKWWFDYANHVVYFHDNPSGHTVELSTATNAFVGPANSVTLQYLTIKEFASPIQQAAVYPQFGSSSDAAKQSKGINWLVEDSEIWGAHGNGINLNYGTQLIGSSVHDNGDLGVSGGLGVSNTAPVPSCSPFATAPFCASAVNSDISSNNYAFVLPGFQAGGFKMGRAFNILLRGNTITNNEGAGIHFDVSSYGGLIDGNTVTGNTDEDGITQEIGSMQSGNHMVIRNNIVKDNGATVLVADWPNYQISSRDSPGVEVYCNVSQVPNAAHVHGNLYFSSNRGNDTNYPGTYYASKGNNFHHNTTIWVSGATGITGAQQGDATNQPGFLAANTAPDYNTYHMSNIAASLFEYGTTTGNITAFRAAGADAHGTIDALYTSGYPTVAITSPTDQSLVGSSVTVAASAAQIGTGISKVEFYVDWVLKSTDTTNPYTFTWTPTSGSHTVAAMAYDTAGVSACNAVTVTH